MNPQGRFVTNHAVTWDGQRGTMYYQQCQCELLVIGKTPEIAYEKICDHIGVMMAAGDPC